MDLQTRKMEFVREFMELRNEEAISRLELLLREEKATAIEDQESMSDEELNRRIDRSEADFEAGRFKTSSELLKHR